MNRSDTETRETLIPASYPELVDERWSAILGEDERQTVIPQPCQQMALELECMGFELE